MKVVRAMLLVVAFASVEVASTQQLTEEQQIRAVRILSNRAISERDVATLKTTWVDDMNVCGSRGTVISGSDSMAKAFELDFDDPEFLAYERVPNTVELSEKGTVAAEAGEWVGSWQKPDGRMLVKGKYLAQWTKRGSRWLIRGELFVGLSCEGSRACLERP